MKNLIQIAVLVCLSLSAGAAQPPPVVSSGWSSTNNAAAARGALGVMSSNETMSAISSASSSITLSNTPDNIGVVNNGGGVGTNLGAVITVIQKEVKPFTSPALGVLVGFTFRESRLGFPGPGAEEALHPVYSTDYGRSWNGGTGYPILTDQKGIRDPAVFECGDLMAVSYTQAKESSQNSTNFPIWIARGTNISPEGWTLATNINLAMPGETMVLANWYLWSPVIVQDGPDVYVFGTVCTNNNVSKEIRYVKGTTNGFPYDFGSTRRLVNSLSAGVTNILDLTPFYRPGYGWLGWYKNESSLVIDAARGQQVQLGRFANGLTNAFTSVLEGDIGFGGQYWGSPNEGNWSVQLPNGKERVFMLRFGQKYYGYNGDGRVLCYSEASVITNAAETSSGWMPLSNSVTPCYWQSFKPYLVTSIPRITAWKALADGAGYARGELVIQPEIGAFGSSQGKTLYGYAYSSPYPYASDASQSVTTNGAGRYTNDYAALSFGFGGAGGGLFGDSKDMSVKLWVW